MQYDLKILFVMTPKRIVYFTLFTIDWKEIIMVLEKNSNTFALLYKRLRGKKSEDKVIFTTAIKLQ